MKKNYIHFIFALLWIGMISVFIVACHHKNAPSASTDKKKKKKKDTEVVVDKNKIRATIIKNLILKSDGSYESFLLDTITSAKCILKFPAGSFELAKKNGYSIYDVVDSCQNRVFTVIYRMVSELKCSEIEFSSLWRPFTPGNPNSPHNTGRGIDIVRMKSKYGSTWFSINAGKDESTYVKLIRAWCYPNNKDIVQYFSPWQMCNEKTSCGGSCCVNDQTSPNHKLHLTHMHLTVKSD